MPTYKDAGVDLDRADDIVGSLADIQAETERSGSRGLMRAFGQFAACYDLSDYENPVMVSTCDGVGTKFILQREYDALDLAGRDLVAMNVNDILTTGADPLVFLDYVAMSPLEKETIVPVVEGIGEACKDVDCILAGGETAELPGILEEGDLELSGFCVGAAEKERIEKSPPVEAGQRIVAFPSDGFHANGFSLVRKVIDENPDEFSEDDIRSLLTPTRLYRDVVRTIYDRGNQPSAMVHVTGGGLQGNLERVLPDGVSAEISLSRWTLPAARTVLDHVPQEEAFRTFNMGFGWLVILDELSAIDVRNNVSEAVLLGDITEDEDTIEITYGRN
ncbi:MAG: phosphoribosylformylglycinamidine cyclo-ligase [bacterium]